MWETEISTSLYGAAQLRDLDRLAIETHGIASAELMTRAGTAAFLALRSRFPRARRLVVVCGSGNNGGDGYVVARLAKQAGLEPRIATLGASARMSAETAAMRASCEAMGLTPRPFESSQLKDADLIVDALLGIGLERPVQGEWRTAIDAMNASSLPIVAIDIPSGLQADTGAVMGAAVRADLTMSFIGLKIGLFTGAGSEHAGEILLDDLGVPASAYKNIPASARRISEADMREIAPRRARDAHKGLFGHVLVVGGGTGMPGAARLCGEAAARTGAGLVTLATRAAITGCAAPELLAHTVQSATQLKPLFKHATVVACGPGLSQDNWARGMFRAVLAATLPLVIDADALNLLAAKPTRRDDWILTPHPGEAARLLRTTTAKIQQNRVDAVRRLTKRYGGVCVLKGAGTLIASADDDAVWLCDRGNPGMASGGMGDVLTGVIAALRAQGLRAMDAARLGVWLHATAGDRGALRDGEIGMCAGELIPMMRHELNRLTR